MMMTRLKHDGKNNGHYQGWNKQNLGLLKLWNGKTLLGIYDMVMMMMMNMIAVMKILVFTANMMVRILS